MPGRGMERLLVRLPNWLGDVLMSRPLLHALRHTHPGCAIAGVGPRAQRARSVEQALAGGASPEEAGQKALDAVELQDDALASAGYRRQVLPGLVARALGDLS